MRDDSLERAINEPVRLVPHDAAWPARFRRERDRLMRLFPGELIAIEHFGSTAVPGLAAKPVIDLLAGVESMAAADALIDPLLEAGYATSRAYNANLTGRRWLMRHANGHRTHHLHLVVFDGEEWRRRLRFRDALLVDAELVRRYAAVKERLARRYASDREAYTRAKAEFVLSTIGER